MTSSSEAVARLVPTSRVTPPIATYAADPRMMDPALLTALFGGYGLLREQGPVVHGRFVTVPLRGP
jgi:hypothetical protein